MALAFATIPVFAAEPVTTYVPSDAAGVLYMNYEALFGAPAFSSVLESLDLNMNEMLKSAGVEEGEMNVQFVVFVKPDGSGGLIANTHGKSAAFKKFLTESEDFEAKKVEFDGAETYEIKDAENEAHLIMMIVSKDQVQALLSDDMDAKPALCWTAPFASCPTPTMPP